MGEVVVLLRDTEEIENHAAVAIPKHVGDATGRICPQGQGDQVDHGLNLLVEISSALRSL